MKQATYTHERHNANGGRETFRCRGLMDHVLMIDHHVLMFD